MRKLLRLFGWLLLTTIVVWALVIGYWKLADIRPSARDLTVYLGALPLVSFAVLALFKRGLDSASAKASRNLHAEQNAGSDDANNAPVIATAMPIAILADALRLPAGEDASSVLDALAKPASLRLHDTFKDESGFPVFANWAEDVDTDAAMQALEAAGLPTQQCNTEHGRALALLQPVAQDLLQQIATSHWLPPPSIDARNSASTEPVFIRASVFGPIDWSAAMAESVKAWLIAEAQACGIAAEHMAVDVLPTTSASELWQRIATIAAPAKASAAPTLHLLLACHSQIGLRSVQQLDQSGLLLSSQQVEGIVPGEGAAGLVLLAAAADNSFAFAPKAVLRTQTVSHQGVSWQVRTAIAQMEQLLNDTLARVPNSSREALKTLISDTDQRKSRATGVAGFIGKALDWLDPNTDCLATGGACGNIGIVSPLALLALAAEKTLAGDPALALAVAEPDQRAIALILAPDPSAANGLPSLDNAQAT